MWWWCIDVGDLLVKAAALYMGESVVSAAARARVEYAVIVFLSCDF